MTDRVCRILVEKDGRPSEPSEHSLGNEGQFGFRVVRRRCGTARAFVVSIEVSSRCKRDLIGLSAEMEAEG
jgi:hypothetical protein